MKYLRAYRRSKTARSSTVLDTNSRMMFQSILPVRSLLTCRNIICVISRFYDMFPLRYLLIRRSALKRPSADAADVATVMKNAAGRVVLGNYSLNL